MTELSIICVGRMKEKFYIDAAAEYQKRLSPYCRLAITELPEVRLPPSPSEAQIDAALLKEALAVRARLPVNASLAALCVEGRLLSSEELAEMLRSWQVSSARHITFLIGSSNGIHESLKAEARERISLSPMTFPHHLARVMLLEQLYRAFSILNGGKYHK